MSLATQFRRFCTKVPEIVVQPKKPREKLVQVSILGADSGVGMPLSFLLQQNPLVSILHLQGQARITDGIGVDLSHICTKSLAYTYPEEDGIAKAVRSTDVIFLLSTCKLPKDTTFGGRIMAEAPRVVEVAKLCAKYAPKTILVVCIKPISVFTPLVANIYRQTPWYHPARIIGSAAFAQLKANSLTGNYLNLDPSSVHVPILGGPDLDCCIPLFSNACPMNIVGKEAEKLLCCFREQHQHTEMAEAFALNNLATAIAAGLKEEVGERTHFSTFARQNIVQTCSYMVTKVQFGKNGVIHNFGVPHLVRHELQLFERSTLMLHEREEMAYDYLSCERNKLPKFMVKEKHDAEIIKQGIIR